MHFQRRWLINVRAKHMTGQGEIQLRRWKRWMWREDTVGNGAWIKWIRVKELVQREEATQRNYVCSRGFTTVADALLFRQEEKKDAKNTWFVTSQEEHGMRRPGRQSQPHLIKFPNRSCSSSCFTETQTGAHGRRNSAPETRPGRC